MSQRERTDKGMFAPIHGAKHTRLYKVWCAMRERCNNPHNKRYARYGGRGISVCNEWDDYRAFREWAEMNGYADGLTIDRIDTDGNYEPSNCRWATRAEQNRNYSRNRMITFNGITMCLTDWADKYGIKRATLAFRLNSGKTMEQALENTDGRTMRWKTVYSQN